MELKDILYNKRDRIGIKSDVSYGELVELGNTINEWYDSNKKNDDISHKDIEELVKVSLEMKHLLEKCRGNKLPIKLTKSIDEILEKIKYM